MSKRAKNKVLHKFKGISGSIYKVVEEGEYYSGKKIVNVYLVKKRRNGKEYLSDEMNMTVINDLVNHRSKGE